MRPFNFSRNHILKHEQWMYCKLQSSVVTCGYTETPFTLFHVVVRHLSRADENNYSHDLSVHDLSVTKLKCSVV